MTTFHVVTLFPESLESYLGSSIVKRAQEDGRIRIKYYNPRDFVVSSKKGRDLTYADRRVDNRPYGGGPGMVIEALPVIRAIAKAVGRKMSTVSEKKTVKIIFFTPSGRQFTNDLADRFKKYTDVVLICGRYEGIDARIKKIFPMADISIGPFVLTGGELPALVVIDAVARRIPGVLGDEMSLEECRVSSSDVYTRPETVIFKGKKYRVPRILLTGNHAKIERWKLEKRKDCLPRSAERIVHRCS